MTSDFAPLAGVRVVEMSHMIMGPSCGMFLGFLGAEVIKVEPPAGDKTRALSGMGRPFFPLFNRGKKSVRLDLKSEAGRVALDRLLATADVFVENFRDASLAGMGADLADLHRRFPRLILASHKGFLSGPYENRTALDEVVQMMTGLAYMTGPSGRPLRVGSSVNDIMGGLFGALSVVAALRERDHTGQGHAIRIGLFENCLLLVAQHMVQFDLEGHDAAPMPERDFSWPVYDIFTTADHQPIFVGAVTEGQWGALCGFLGLDDLLDDPGLQTKMDQINARDRTVPMVAQAISRWRKAALVAEFERMGIPFAPISKPSDMYSDPHVMRPGGLTTSHLPTGETFRAPSLPFEVDGQMITGGGDVPSIGQDTVEVLSALGLNAAMIAAASGGAT
ncbi:formyl-CoA transferase [Rhodobacter veldkampii DSM 11550]|uniref:Formyl-CoA transferase n=1 Tax=Phaeovulum veldkampii DSM 11550 TaxID=1185920 RepID=A0A2T4JJY5_9RHOB|nr:CoA transferase [Phaeovulum veldkampii]MBK5946115.1 formyl-CoA transferase [Phaeovulum veldkampii DSM 11550]PTE18214.1 formyl-CoA transferase [Phaeovulum veldkampii DSM 11550]TDQ63485.1 crotonobetainyl-CoA:carnitine CoA-transferase CaiB-like acyl-CoA transferase [Phaeovulum veldkampii DSM 11550]